MDLSGIEQQLIDAAKNGDINGVTKAINDGANIHAQDDKAIHNALFNGHKKIVKLLVDHGNRLDQSLINAAIAGDIDTIKEVLKYGADIHAKKNEAFWQAAANGRKEAVTLLLDSGSNIHAENDKALSIASCNGHKETVELLLDRGGDIHAEKDCALSGAAVNNHKKTAEFLLNRGADVHGDNDFALRWAAEYGHMEMVELLLVYGADIHANNDEALSWAARRGRKETIELLLYHGADIHADNDGALCRAAEGDHKEAALLLLRHGADPKVRDSKGKSPSEGTKLTEWLDELRQAASEHFTSDKPSQEQCFVSDEKGTKLHDRVLDAFATGQFIPLIAMPLIASTDKTDRKLFQDIWDAIPHHWQDQYQNLYMQFIKNGGLHPVVGQHTAVTERHSGTHDIVER